MAKIVTLPLDAEAVRELRVGDDVLVSGRLLTGRNKVHRWLASEDDARVRELARGTLVYHCGPVVSQDPVTKEYRFVAAGPTSSMREEPYQADVIARYGLRGVIGKGGMGPRTLAALKAHAAVYLHAIGGLAVVLARHVTKVHGVLKLDEFGVPEAIWDVEVKDFPAVVTMDAHGASLHETIGADALAKELLDRKAG
jgi:fumarate hydratase subunit beta